MKLIISISTIAFAVSTIAGPIPSKILLADGTKSGAIAARQGIRLEVYKDTGFRGDNEILLTSPGECKTLGNGWPGEISSLSVFAGTTCTLYSGDNCNEEQASAPAGEWGDLGDLWNDTARSYMCSLV